MATPGLPKVVPVSTTTATASAAGLSVATPVAAPAINDQYAIAFDRGWFRTSIVTRTNSVGEIDSTLTVCKMGSGVPENAFTVWREITDMALDTLCRMLTDTENMLLEDALVDQIGHDTDKKMKQLLQWCFDDSASHNAGISKYLLLEAREQNLNPAIRQQIKTGGSLTTKTSARGKVTTTKRENYIFTTTAQRPSEITDYKVGDVILSPAIADDVWKAIGTLKDELARVIASDVNLKDICSLEYNYADTASSKGSRFEKTLQDIYSDGFERQSNGDVKDKSKTVTYTTKWVNFCTFLALNIKQRALFKLKRYVDWCRVIADLILFLKDATNTFKKGDKADTVNNDRIVDKIKDKSIVNWDKIDYDNGTNAGKLITTCNSILSDLGYQQQTGDDFNTLITTIVKNVGESPYAYIIKSGRMQDRTFGADPTQNVKDPFFLWSDMYKKELYKDGVFGKFGRRRKESMFALKPYSGIAPGTSHWFQAVRMATHARYRMLAIESSQASKRRRLNHGDNEGDDPSDEFSEEPFKVSRQQRYAFPREQRMEDMKTVAALMARLLGAKPKQKEWFTRHNLKEKANKVPALIDTNRSLSTSQEEKNYIKKIIEKAIKSYGIHVKDSDNIDSVEYEAAKQIAATFTKTQMPYRSELNEAINTFSYVPTNFQSNLTNRHAGSGVALSEYAVQSHTFPNDASKTLEKAMEDIYDVLEEDDPDLEQFVKIFQEKLKTEIDMAALLASSAPISTSLLASASSSDVDKDDEEFVLIPSNNNNPVAEIYVDSKKWWFVGGTPSLFTCAATFTLQYLAEKFK